jgi:site-specific DNA-methyltransferase (adenine-specific)
LNWNGIELPEKNIYFKDDDVVIYCADCREILPLIPDKSIDLVLTDPPYGINIAKNGTVGGTNLAVTKNYGASDWDNERLDAVVINEIQRIGFNQIIFGGNYIADLLSPSPCWIIWDKRDNLPSNNFADCELIWTSFKSPSRLYKFLWQGMLQKNMSDKEYRYHPTQKPLEIVGRLIETYSKQVDSILDPFLGSGTTAVCAKKLGRKCIGIEIEEKYCEIAVDRLRQSVMKLEVL